MENLYGFNEKYFNELWLCYKNKDLYGVWRNVYNEYMDFGNLLSPNLISNLNMEEVGTIRGMGIDTRTSVDILNNAIYYFETIGDYQKAENLLEIKLIIQDSFRNMVKLLQVTMFFRDKPEKKPQSGMLHPIK
jgi:hypothetical protein